MEKHLEPYLVHKKKEKPAVIVFSSRPRGRGRQAMELEKISEDIGIRLIAERLPVYPSISRAARAAKKVITYYDNKRKAADG
jgi:hypothetical protein